MFPLPIHIYFEIAALGASIIFWYKLRDTRLQWLLPFMIFIVGIELTGRYIRTELQQPNAWLYNLSVPIEYLFYGFLFYLHFQRKVFRQAAMVFLIGFSIFAICNILFIQGIERFNTNILKVGSFCMIILSCFYFVELLSREDQFNLITEPMFWIASGVFLFNTGEFFYTLFSDYLIKNHLDRTRKIFSSINNKLIWVLYTCIAISIICIKQRRYQKA
jgi:hypothetical protein